MTGKQTLTAFVALTLCICVHVAPATSLTSMIEMLLKHALIAPSLVDSISPVIVASKSRKRHVPYFLDFKLFIKQVVANVFAIVVPASIVWLRAFTLAKVVQVILSLDEFLPWYR